MLKEFRKKRKENKIEKRTQKYIKRQAKEEEVVSSLSGVGPFIPLILSALWIILMASGDGDVSVFKCVVLISFSLLYLFISLKERKKKKEEKEKRKDEDDMENL